MLKKLQREEGFAIITAVMTSVVVVLLGTTVVQLAVHNSESSSYDRRHVQSIGAAESGLDYYMSFLTATGGQTPPCMVNKPMEGSPGRFTVTPTFYDSTGAVISDFTCANPNLQTTPSAVLLHSVGCSKTIPAVDPVSATPGVYECEPITDRSEMSRTMEAYAKLSVATGGTFDNAGAIVAQNSVNFTSNATIGGNNYSDADVYSNGTVTLASGSTLYGKVYVQGAFTMASNSEVKKDVSANGGITMSSKAIIRGSATSSNSSITLANNATIYGTAKAKLSITGGTVVGGRSANQNPAPEAVPARTYPAFTYTPSDWTTAGFTNPGDFATCSAAETYIRSTWTTGNLLVRITAPGSSCTLTFATNTTYSMKGNLAVISQGPVTFSTNSRFVPPASGTANVFLFAGLSGTAPCNITMNSNAGFNPGITTLMYVPSTCTIDMLSNTALSQGQIMAGTVNFKHTAQYSYSRLTVPGTGAGGFKQDLTYKREIID